MPKPAATKINSGTVLLGFFAVLVGLAGTYTVRVAMAEPPEVELPPPPPPPPKPKPVRITIPLASRDLVAGTTISMDDIAIYRMTREEIKETIKA